MDASSTKKRKRAQLEAEAPDPQLRQKIRVVGNASTRDELREERLLQKSLKDGKSRQDKSERRSKKQKKATAQNPAADDVGQGAVDPKLERAHKKHKVKVSEEPGSGHPVPTIDKSPPAANGNGATLHKAKCHTKSITTQTVQDEVSPNESAAEGLQKNSKPQRFILFIGNLPYSATTPQIQSHFSKLSPTSIRHSTDKSTGRSKGFAFLEFAGYDKMKTCLKLYHHSIFDPEISNDSQANSRKDQKKAGRRINVELTVGGGGHSSEKRKEKIKGKNLKLEEERERRRLKELEDGEKETKSKSKNATTDANATSTAEKDRDMGDIHPSRRGRVG